MLGAGLPSWPGGCSYSRGRWGLVGRFEGPRGRDGYRAELWNLTYRRVGVGDWGSGAAHCRGTLALFSGSLSC